MRYPLLFSLIDRMRNNPSANVAKEGLVHYCSYNMFIFYDWYYEEKVFDKDQSILERPSTWQNTAISICIFLNGC